MANDRTRRVMEQLAVAGVASYRDLEPLVGYVIELGATDEEIVDAARRGLGLGPLALDLSIRPAGETVSLDAFARDSGLDADVVRRLWRAFGLRDSPEFRVTPDIAEAMRVMAFLMGEVGDETVLGFARVMAAATAQVADALAGISRMGIEQPRLDTGLPYSSVVREYTATARDLLPTLWEAIGAVFRRQLVHLSYQEWAPDDDRAAVTQQRTIGFVDLVGSTEAQRALTVAELADQVNRFEQLVWDVVADAGGRLVKLIGDEAMFVFDSPARACRLAITLIEQSPQRVRVGLAHGGVVAFHGDYYGPTVNLAARLVAAASPSSAMVSESVQTAAADAFTFDAVTNLDLRGFSDVTVAYAIRP